MHGLRGLLGAEKEKGERWTGRKAEGEGRVKEKQQSSTIRTNLTNREALVCRPLQCWLPRSGEAAKKKNEKTNPPFKKPTLKGRKTSNCIFVKLVLIVVVRVVFSFSAKDD